MPDLGQQQLNKKIADSQTLQKECEAIEAELAALKVAYEQYFLGVERQPPNQAHKELKSRFNQLRNSFVRQTALKFRIQGLNNKILSYERLWARTMQEIEDGTYKRDLFKAKHRRQEPPKPGAEAKAAKPAGDDFDVDEAPPPPPAAAARPAPPKPAAASGALSDNQVKAIYDAYVTAKKRCNEDVSRITLDAMAQNLRKQVPALMKQHNAKSVEFKIVIKDGKAVLKAIPKT